MFLTANKIEIPQRVLDKLAENNLELKDFIVNTKKLENGHVSTDQLQKDSFSLSTITSYWKNFAKRFNEYLKFLSDYTKRRVNLVELVYLIRPIIYLSLMIIFKKRSFIPLIVNLILDLIILNFKRREDKFNNQKVFAHEYIYRVGKIATYFLRDPIFTLITKPFIRKIMRILRLPNFIVEIVLNVLSYHTNLYFIL